MKKDQAAAAAAAAIIILGRTKAKNTNNFIIINVIYIINSWALMISFLTNY
jgi:hypothetical protein